MEKGIKHLKRLASLLILIISTVLFSLASYDVSLPTEDEIFYGYDGVRHLIVPAIICCLFYYSFVRFRTIYNESLRNKYLQSEKKQNFFTFVFGNPEIWFDILGFAVVLFAFDLDKTFGFLTEMPIYGENKAIVCLISLAVLLILGVLARYNASRLWAPSELTSPPSSSPSIDATSSSARGIGSPRRSRIHQLYAVSTWPVL